jgi:hypothetical protein
MMHNGKNRLSILICIIGVSIFASCADPLSQDPAGASSLVVRITDHSSGGSSGPGSSGLGGSFFSDLVDMSVRILVAEEELINGGSGSVRSRVAELAAGTASESGPSSISLRYNELYIPSGLAASGRNDMGRFAIGRRYLLLVIVDGTDAENAERTAYGYSRFTTTAGENRVAVTLQEDRNQLRQSLLNWYGITLLFDGLNVSIDLSDPSQPVVNFSGQTPSLDKTLGQVMNVNATAGFAGYEWYLNGGFDGNGSTHVLDSAGLPYGTHLVTLVVTDDNGLPYTAGFSFSVVGN